MLLQQLLLNDLEFISPVIQRHAYFCHPENMLSSLFSDNDILLRQKEVATILELRIITEAQDIEYILPSLKLYSDTFKYDRLGRVVCHRSSFYKMPLE